MEPCPRRRLVPPRLIVVAVLIGGMLAWFSTGKVSRPPPQLRLVVHGPPGTVVSVRREFDGRVEESSDPVPVEYSGAARRAEFSVRDEDRSDRVIRAALLVDNVLQETGTAVRGVHGRFEQRPAGRYSSFNADWELTERGTLEGGAESGAGDLQPSDLLGTRPPEWTVREWANSSPLRLSDLRGRVVLVRWLASPSCPQCAASAPALREFHENFHDVGLSVIGMHHNSIGATLEDVEEDVREFGFEFPVAIDRGTATRQLWCHGNKGCRFTSATFLLDRQGRIRFIHPGGQYVRGDGVFESLEDAVVRLLCEPEQVPGHDAGDNGQIDPQTTSAARSRAE
jgi:peroxiredoxin